MVLTAIGKFVFMDWLDLRLAFVSVAVISWVCYIVYRSRRDPGVLKHWGFRRDNVGKVARIVWPFVVLALVAFVVIGVAQGTINLTWHILPILITYPLSGVIQQFLLVGLVAGNLHDLDNVRLKEQVLILRIALFFAAGPYPHRWDIS